MRKERKTVNWIVSLIGVDLELLHRAGGDNVDKFYICGLLVIVAFLVSFLSVFYAFELMFHKWYAELLLAGFFSFTFLNIYLFLIQTFSKEGLPPGYKVSFFSTSNLARFGFVIMIGFLIAQPVRIYLMQDRLEPEIARYREQLYRTFASRNAALYGSDLARLTVRRTQLSHLTDDARSLAMKSSCAAEIDGIMTRIAQDNEAARVKIGRSDFFLQRISLCARYRGSWWICLGVMLLFVLPVLLIYSISGNSAYYRAKIKRDHKFIREHYQAFRMAYQNLLGIGFYEYCDDPPFNWSPKKQAVHGTAEDFQRSRHSV